MRKPPPKLRSLGDDWEISQEAKPVITRPRFTERHYKTNWAKKPVFVNYIQYGPLDG